MKLGILETGMVPDTMIATHGDYESMFGGLIQAADPSITVHPVQVVEGVLPEAPDACDAWLVTGSKYGVYDDLPWIEPLKGFLRDARAAGVPMIGVCFGHQIMAEAFGGRAVKSEKGWGVGVHDYRITRRPEWMGSGDGQAFTMHAMHQDQVTALPADATVLAQSEFCENAMLSYGDPERPDAISIQPHPEFTAPYARDLVLFRAGDTLPKERSEAALATFGRPVANAAFAEWAVAYLRLVLAARKAA